MTYDSQIHHRRSLRLKGHDYSQAGAYFITVCAQDRACLLGDIVGEQMRLNDAGRMVLEEWKELPVRFPVVELDVFGVMPNHIHGIIVIVADNLKVNADVNGSGNKNTDHVGAGLVPAPPPPPSTLARQGATTRVAPTPTLDAIRLSTLGDIVGAFKSLTTDRYIHGVRQSGWPSFRGRLWQRNYHEHIIRNDESLQRIRQYILDNPARWESDPENPQTGRKT